VRFPRAAPKLERRDDIWPTDTAPVIRQIEDGIEFVQLRWGFPLSRPKGAPVINFRSEGRRFPKGRCLIPASHFFEFTGSKSPKSKWKFTKAGEDWFCFAGLWPRCPMTPATPSRSSRPRTRRSADPQSTGGGSRTPGLAGLARSDPVSWTRLSISPPPFDRSGVPPQRGAGM